MTDDDEDADIARMIARRRNIERLGISYYLGNPGVHGEGVRVPVELQRERRNARQRERRARMREQGIVRSDKRKKSA